MSDDMTAQCNDRVIWEAKKSDRYLLPPSIHVTDGDGIGINVAGSVYVMTIEKWHALPTLLTAKEAELAEAVKWQDRKFNEGYDKAESQFKPLAVESMAKVAALTDKLREAEQALTGRTVSCVCGGKTVGVDVEEGRRGI